MCTPFLKEQYIYIYERIGVKRRNKQPTTDLCDRVVILSTSFGYNNDLFCFYFILTVTHRSVTCSECHSLDLEVGVC